MKLVAILALVLAGAALIGVLAFAALGMPFAAIFSGCAVAWFLLVASREADAAAEEAAWIDSRRHPRL